MQVRTSQAVKTGAMLMVGASLLTSGLTVTAQAKDRHDRDRYESKNEKKADNLKKGAIVLGVVGAVLAAKGKTLPGAAVAAGGYYLYKKGRGEDRNDDRYPGYRNGNDRDRNNRDDRYRDGRYDGGYNYGGNYGGTRGDRDYGYDRGNDYDRGYDYDANYNDRNRNNDDCDRRDNGNHGNDNRGNGRGRNERGNRSYSVR